MLARLHRNVTVEGRHLAMAPEKYYDLKTWGEANDVWIEVSQELGEQALCRALHHAGLETSELGSTFFHVSYRDIEPFDRCSTDQPHGAFAEHPATCRYLG